VEAIGLGFMAGASGKLLVQKGEQIIERRILDLSGECLWVLEIKNC
jgi:hypothetical protein